MLIGRKKEQEFLQGLLKGDKSHFIAVYGRRRVGKTFLIRQSYGDRFTFYHTGLYESSMEDQLEAFALSLKNAGFPVQGRLKGWLEAFDCLRELTEKSVERKKVIFIDELSWMDTPKSRFITGLEHFWNQYASARNDIILIVCASATSWMLSNVIHSKGGLYNRLTGQINLQCFDLSECEEYIRAQGLVVPREQILEYYMIFGGVPYYWSFLRKGLSAKQNIDNIIFGPDAPLKDEYKYLYASIFKNPDDYLRIVEALSGKKMGMTRDEIISHTHLNNSGNLSRRLEELESCAFIRKYKAYAAKSKGCVYQITDNFTLFYHHFMKGAPTDPHYWMNQVNMPAVNTWKGLAFERVCLLHIEKIKQKLGISGVLTDVNSWQCRADAEKGIFGSQADLLIVRKDGIINLCEMKYSSVEYTFTAKDYKSMQRRIHDFQTVTKTRYAIHPTLVTCVGLVDNTYSSEIQTVVTLDDLF